MRGKKMHTRTHLNLKSRLFWKIGFFHLLVLLLVLIILDIYVVRILKREYQQATFAQLEAFSHLALYELPQSSDLQTLVVWSNRIAQGGIRTTLLAEDGKVRADSNEDPSRMKNHRERPEIREAFASGLGRAIRYSPTLKQDFVYFAQKITVNGERMVIRFSLPVSRLDEGVAGFRKRFWGVSLLMLVLAGGIGLVFYRTISNRIGRLSEFSRNVAGGNFHPLPLDRNNDELADLSGTLNQTALKLDQTIKALIGEKNQSAAILAGMEEGVVVVDTDKRVIFCNSAFREAAGVSNVSWEGRPVMELIRHSDLLSLLQKASTCNEVIHGEMTVGSVRTNSFAVTCAPIQTNASSAGTVMVLHDISEIRRLERARRDFVANVSHEFRTPLTAIRGFAETLLDGGLEDVDNRRRFIEIIYNHSLRLVSLTDDLLRLAQIESEQLPLEFVPVAIAAFVEPCIETTRVKAKQKDLVLETDFVPDLPPIRGDIRALQGVLQELLDNAIRYSSPGGKIGIKMAAQGSEIVISVSDTGIGIPQADQERIFERFYRTDPARSRESGGTGLGLSIAKHMIEAHGGRIKVESEVGRGSTFHIFLPVQPMAV
jgi:two-component system, OmpR family, phosphate regulon sensor histidine kinase PhoR